MRLPEEEASAAELEQTMKDDLVNRLQTPDDFNALQAAAADAMRDARNNPSHYGMSVAEAAAAIGVSSRVIQKWIARGTIEAIRLTGFGPRWFISPEEVRRTVRGRKVWADRARRDTI